MEDPPVCPSGTALHTAPRQFPERTRTASTPRPTAVTVLMPVYNGAEYVCEAIDSVLSQTHSEFEFLIVDDGSTDETPELLRRHAAPDPRVRIVRQENRDQPATLNRGLHLARHDWVAIIDHDDVCLPDRLAEQVAMREREPEARLIGTWGFEINGEGRRLRRRDRGPRSAEEFRTLRGAGQRVPLIHSSVLMHRPTVLAVGGYDPRFGPSADTELWSRVARQHVIVVVPRPLVLYRVHRHSMSFTRLFEQRRMLRLIAERTAAREKGEEPVTLDAFLAVRPWWSARRWAELRSDMFWYFRSHCLLALSERARARAAVYGLGAALVAPGNAWRLARRMARGERLALSPQQSA